MPLAAEALAHSDHPRGIRACDPLRRMSWVSGVRNAGASPIGCIESTALALQEVWQVERRHLLNLLEVRNLAKRDSS